MQTHDRQARHDEVPANRSLATVRRDAPSRRTFLIGGTAAGVVAAATTLDRAQAQPIIRTETASQVPAAAIGYWDAQRNTIVTAARLPWGDRSLIETGARVTVHGLGNERPDPGISAFALLAHFPTKQAGITVKFHAWKYRSDTMNHRSSPVSFCMPVSRTGGLALSVVYPKKSDAEGASGLIRSEHVCAFSAGALNKQPKLRPGTYFVALPDGRSNALPNWDECRFVPEYQDGVLTGGTLCQATLTGLEPVTFHYLVLSVESGMAPRTATV